ncbi:hypothetical protein [Streptomyces sp. NPDC058622]|uniref:hypothetical protein n=1 Tax=Streptomyces sp. NPDC058622 TaxID=3346562 RepID=UPI00364A8F0F
MKSSRARATGLTTTAVVTLILGTASSASADNGHVGRTETVCATDLSFRSGANSGAWMGYLHRGDKIRLEQRNGNYVRGFSARHNRTGWVQDGWFC